MPRYHNEEDILCQAVQKTIRYHPILPHVVEYVVDSRTGYADERGDEGYGSGQQSGQGRIGSTGHDLGVAQQKCG